MKVWVYSPRSYGGFLVFSSVEPILKDMEDDLEWAKEQDPEPGGTWDITDTQVWVDDGGRAELVEVDSYV